jgi:hypothetical protein
MLIEKSFGLDHEAAQRMIGATKNMVNAKSGDNGFQCTKTFLFGEYAVLKMKNINVRNIDMQDKDLRHLENIAETLLGLQAKGINAVPILYFQGNDKGDGYVIQPRAKGEELYDRHRLNDKVYVQERVSYLANAPQRHFDKFVADTIKIIEAGLLIDFMGKDNFFYHETDGFQFIDLIAHDDFIYGLDDEAPQGIPTAVRRCFIPCYFDPAPQYRDTVSKLLSELTDEERVVLMDRNKTIFEKCKTAMINNGIAQEAIDEVIANKEFIPQRQQVGLL